MVPSVSVLLYDIFRLLVPTKAENKPLVPLAVCLNELNLCYIFLWTCERADPRMIHALIHNDSDNKSTAKNRRTGVFPVL